MFGGDPVFVWAYGPYCSQVNVSFVLLFVQSLRSAFASVGMRNAEYHACLSKRGHYSGVAHVNDGIAVRNNIVAFVAKHHNNKAVAFGRQIAQSFIAPTMMFANSELAQSDLLT